jgi:alpha-1,3-mannosyltransferase
VQQARDRYAPLIGHNPPPSKSWLFDFGLGNLDPVPRPSQKEASFYNHRRDLSPEAGEHKYFFAINLYNSFDVVPDLLATLFRVSAILGYHNVYVSIYENGSTDQTKALLRIFDALARSVGLRVTIRTSQRTRGAFNHRIEYLAEVRNAAFVPLHELRNAENEYFDTIVFMNDILPCVDDLLELIYQSRLNNAGITCAADYMYHDELVRSPPSVPCNWLTC